MSDNIRGKRWCMTLNNFSQEELDGLSKIKCEYMIYGLEHASTGTPHVQGYFVFKNVKRLSTLKRQVPRAHWERSIGTHEQNINYCSKEDRQPFEKGTKPVSRKYKIDAKQVLKEDPINGPKKLASLRTIKGMRLEKQMMSEIFFDALVKPRIVYIHGSSGSGKSYFALQNAIMEYGTNNVSTIRFDKNGFAHCSDPQSDCLVWMEFRPSCLDAVTFLEFTDGYGMHLNVKHGSVYIRPKCLYICSILPPDEIYKEEINIQFKRRITEIINKDLNPYHNYIDNEETEGEVVEWNSD